jgi:glycosyltransferase involved in cell wall biosynthesis
VVIHGLEYEFMPEAYSSWERLYMRFSIKKSCQWAQKVIAVSKNTKKDLKKIYGVPDEKVKVIYEGYDKNYLFPDCLVDGRVPDSQEKFKIQNYKPYLLFVGRLEKRKNIEGIIAAFEIMKEKHKIPHKLVLAGKPGYGWEDIAEKIDNSKYKKDIIQTGFIDEAEKWKLFQEADIFLFPTFYEGFGLPILEAQASGVPVISSNVSSLPEVAGEGALYVSPGEPSPLSEVVNKLVNDRELRDAIIKKGHENLERFDWKRCSEEIAGLIIRSNK